jgi:hypothetical protein
VLFALITKINTFLSDPHYNDNLTYHYTGGHALSDVTARLGLKAAAKARL